MKDQGIETLRGVAILLVVSGYIILDDLSGATSGSRSVFSSLLHHAYYILKPIRMPLFTVISAYLYACSPVVRETFSKLVLGKFRRIMIPFFTVSTLQYVLFSVLQVHGEHPLNQIYHIYFYPFEQFWFLYAVFWIFMAVGFLDSMQALSTPRKWLFWLVLVSITHVLFDAPRPLAAKGVNYLLPFFLLGYGICRYPQILFTPRMLKIYTCGAIVAYALYLPFYQKLGFAQSLFKLLALGVTFSVIPLLFHFRPHIPLLAKIGYYAFGIYIFNKISMAFVRRIFEYFHITNDVLIFTTYLTAGIVLAIGFQWLCEQFSLSRKFILGIKPLPPAAPPAASPAAPALLQPAGMARSPR